MLWFRLWYRREMEKAQHCVQLMLLVLAMLSLTVLQPWCPVKAEVVPIDRLADQIILLIAVLHYRLCCATKREVALKCSGVLSSKSFSLNCEQIGINIANLHGDFTVRIITTTVRCKSQEACSETAQIVFRPSHGVLRPQKLYMVT
jgi:hypothetical protein